MHSNVSESGSLDLTIALSFPYEGGPDAVPDPSEEGVVQEFPNRSRL